MGQALFCDCCGDVVAEGTKYYMIPEMQTQVTKPWRTQSPMEISVKPTGRQFLVCLNCIAEVGIRVKERNEPIEFEVEVENGDQNQD